MLKTRWKKGIVGLTVAATVWTGAAAFAPEASAAGTPFTDVAAGHWAEKHINKLYLQQLMIGDKGLFRPSASVSREEAVLIAIRFMGLEDQVDKSAVIAFPESFQVSNYFKPYIQFAINRKIIVSSEEFALAAQEKKPWGSSPASREWIARLLVRAIGKDAEAAAVADQETAFADDDSISDPYRGYINVAIASKLVNGMTETTFEPQTLVNRATIATLFSRAQASYNGVFAGQTTGILYDLTPDKLTVLHANGAMTDYALDADTAYYRYDSEKASTIDGLTRYGQVTVISSGGGKADYVEQLGDTPMIRTVEGKFISLGAGGKPELTLLVGGETQTIAYDSAREPAVVDAENQPLTLSSLTFGQELQLTVDTVRTPNKILSILVRESTVNKSGKGTVAEIDAAAMRIRIQDEASGQLETRNVAANATVRRAGLSVPLSEVRAGDAISYEVKNGEVTSIVIDKQAVNAVTAKLFKVDTDTRTIQYTLNGQQVWNEYAANVTVSINGLSDAGLLDLVVGDTVTLTFQDDGKIKSIAVSDRDMETINGLSIRHYDAELKLLVLIDNTSGANLKSYSFTIGANTRFDLDGSRISFDNARQYLVQGRKVNVGLADDQLVHLSFVTKYAGTVTENNTTNRTMKIQLANGTIVPIAYGYPSIDIYGRTNETMADVKVGDYVSVTLNTSSDSVSYVQVRSTVQFEIVSADVSGSRIKVKRSDGQTVEWYIGSTIGLQDENGNAASIGSFAAGTIVNVTFLGDTATLIKKVPVQYGRVTAVDPATGTIDIKTGTAGAVKHTVGTSPTVVRNGVTSSNLAFVQTDDRVFIRKDEQERTVITVISPTSRKFYNYNASLGEIYFLTSPGMPGSAKYDPQLYVHQGDQTLSLGSLKNGDALLVYIVQGKAVEIVKQ